MTPGVSAPAAYPFPDGLLADLLVVSLTAVTVLRPVYNPTGELADFATEYLNPAAQRMTHLAEQPGGTLLGHFPHTVPSGVFDYYRRAYETGEAAVFDINYQADGLDNYFRLAARRSGELLVVSFTDTADHPRSSVEKVLRESQAAEQAARAEAEAQRQRFYEVLMHLPAQVATYRGPEHVFSFVNPRFQAFVSSHEVLGQPVREAAKGAVGEEVFAVLDQVYTTGQPVHLHELEVQLEQHRPGRDEPVFVDAFYHPLRDAQGRVDGVLDFSYDVTEQVLARRRVEQLNRELERRVAERTEQLEAARAETERQRARLERFFMQAPAAICVHDGPDLVYELVNPTYQRLFPGRELLGKALLDAMPEAADMNAYHTVRRVYETGKTFEARGVYLPLPGPDGQPRALYFDLIQQPRFDEHGHVDGVLVFGFEVTEQVLAHQRAAALQAQLLAAAQRQAHEREAFYQVFEQTPAQIALLRGPSHRFEYVNPAYQQLFPDRALAGLDIAEALPGVREQGFLDLLDRVYRTGETYFGQELPFEWEATVLAPRISYFNFTYQAYRENGRIVGISIFAYEVTEQVLARRERAAQQQRLREVFEQAPVAICVLDGPDYVLDVVNPQMLALWDRSLESAAGRPFFEALPELTDQGLREVLDAVRRTGQPFVAQEMEFHLARHAPSETGVYNFVYQPLHDDQGRVAAITSVATDVTEQVRARQRVSTANEELRTRNAELAASRQALLDAADQLSRQRATFEQIFAETPAAICIQRGPDHRFEYLNAAYQAFFPGRQLLGLPVAAAVPEIADTDLVERLDHVYHTGETYYGYEVPLFLAQPDGALRQLYFTFTYQAYREQGEIVGISTFAHDVSSQVVARREREAERQRLLALFAQAPAGICILAGPELLFEFVNPAYQRLLPGRVLQGRPVFEALPEILDTPVSAILRRVYATGILHEEQALHIPVARPGDGALEDRYFTFVYQGRRDTEGRVDGILAFVFEVTEQVSARRQAEASAQQAQALSAELQAANQQLTRTNVDLDNFIYTASHDLKAPITNIEGLLDTLRHELPEPLPTGEVSYIMALMQDSVNRFKRTIEHLTAVSKLQKEHNPPTAPVALTPVVEDVCLDLTPLLQQTGGRLHIALHDCPRLTFAEKNLRSVVYNLLSNALKYHHPDRPPEVWVRCRTEGTFSVLEVQDNGLGIDLSRQEQLFAMFQRLHTHVEGSGIGLYMVKRMVENVGGRITVNSRLGEGTTFAVYFPR